MAIAFKNIILGDDFNNYVAGSADGTYDHSVPNVGTIWGDGQGRYGYGQDLSAIAPVNQGPIKDTIRPQEWNSLDGILFSIRNHQGESYSLLPTGTIASKVAITHEVLQTFAPKIIAAYNDVGKCDINIDGQTNISQSAGPWGIVDGSGNSKRILKLKHVINFTNADTARYFFNAGGKLKLNYNINLPDLPNPRDLFWRDMCEGAGTIEIGYRNTLKYNLAGLNPDPLFDYYRERDFVLNQNNGGYWAHQPLAENALLEHYRQNYVSYRWQDYEYDYRYNYGNYSYYGQGSPDYLKVEMSVGGRDGKTGNIGKTITIITSFINGTVPVDANDTLFSTVSSRLVVSEPALGYLSIPSWAGYEVDADIEYA